MKELFPYDIPDDVYDLVKGELLNKLIRGVQHSQVTTGPGLFMHRGAAGTHLWVDPSFQPTPLQFARVTGAGSEPGRFEGVEVPALEGGDNVPDWADTNELYNTAGLGELYSIDGMPYMPTGSFHVQLLDAKLEDGDGEVTSVKAFFHPVPHFATFPVLMQEDGNGSAGSKTEQCSFTYTVTDPRGNTLATALNPIEDGFHTRPTVGEMTAATHGLAYYTGPPSQPATVLYIAQCDEYLDGEACSS